MSREAPAVNLIGNGRLLKIRAGCVGDPVRIMLDDEDITARLRSLRLEMKAGQVNRAFFEMYPGAIDAEISVEAQDEAYEEAVKRIFERIEESSELLSSRPALIVLREIAQEQGEKISALFRRYDEDPQFSSEVDLRVAKLLLDGKAATELSLHLADLLCGLQKGRAVIDGSAQSYDEIASEIATELSGYRQKEACK